MSFPGSLNEPVCFVADGSVRDGAPVPVCLDERDLGAKKRARHVMSGPQAWEEEGLDSATLGSVVPRYAMRHEQPVVEPQVSHLRQVPLRTRVKLAQLGQGSPS